MEEDILFRPLYRHPTFVVIPMTIWDAPIRATEKIIWGEISITQDLELGGSKATDQHLSRVANCSRPHVQHCLRDMEKEGYIERVNKETGRLYTITPAWLPVL